VRRLLGSLCNWTIGPQYVASGSSLSRCSPAAVRDLARAEATCDRTSMRPVISFTKGGGGRRAERRVKAERVGVRGGVYRKRHKWRIRFLEQTLLPLPVDPGERWGNTLGVMEAK
jgi:hypothetical protein